MNTLTPWNPMKELEELENRIGSWFRRTPSSRNIGKESMRATQWAPLVDIAEDNKEYLITADLPEVQKEDVKVTVHDGVLMLSGERKSEKEEKGKKYHRVERTYGSFERSFTVPDDAEESTVAAEFKNGVLKVHLLKSEKAKAKTHEVKVS